MKPKVLTKCVASNYEGGDERIIEFSNGERSQSKHRGGLICIRNMPDGCVHIYVYRCDHGVFVSTSERPQ